MTSNRREQKIKKALTEALQKRAREGFFAVINDTASVANNVICSGFFEESASK